MSLRAMIRLHYLWLSVVWLCNVVVSRGTAVRGSPCRPRFSYWSVGCVAKRGGGPGHATHCGCSTFPYVTHMAHVLVEDVRTSLRVRHPAQYGTMIILGIVRGTGVPPEPTQS
ncbi:hypothetical protein EDD15DRAFT_2285588 [Pisolithus albus]|nr:hypothetical protein EDD15DRAFT_2285588 [Pisolithus albus]